MNNNYPKNTAANAHLKSCLHCQTLMPLTVDYCPTCKARVFTRKPHSLQMTVALLITAFLLFFPANLMPTMRTLSLFGEQSDTILSGVVYLWQHGDKPVALVVFIASFITPLFKMISLAYLCVMAGLKSKKHIRFRAKLYHFNELIGRWSMIDVFVVALLGALVQMGALATIEPALAIVAFAAVVFLTMFAMANFDPRLIWDHAENQVDEIEKNKKNNLFPPESVD